jgi:hypothetical protein
MAAQQEAEGAHQEEMQQAAGEVNKRRLRGKQEAGALSDMRRRRDKRAIMNNARLASGRQTTMTRVDKYSTLGKWAAEQKSL